MPNLYTNSIDQAIDSNGNVYPGAKRYFYDNGTTNTRTIWQDNGKTIEHANPVVADGAGVFPQIFIEGSYSTRLETATGALIDTQDDVNVTITDILANQSSSGATLTNLDYDEASSSGLDFAYSLGRIDDEDGTITAVSGGSLTLAAGQTSYIYLDYTSQTVVNQTTLGRNNSSLLYTVVTDGSAITSVTREKDTFREPNHLPPGYFSGLGLSLGADTDHDVTVAVGRCRDSSDANDITFSTTITKRIDAAHADGNNAGGLFSGTVAADTTYYMFVLGKADGTVDAGFDTDGSAANKPVAWVYHRQVGTLETDASGNIDPLSIRGATLADKIAFGEAGSPKIQKEAIDGTDIEAGTNLIINESVTTDPNAPSFEFERTARAGGTYNVRVDITTSNSTDGNGLAQFYVNGVAVGTQTNAENLSATGTNEQFTLAKGDTISVRVFESSASSRTSMTTRLRMGVSDDSATAYGLPFAEQDSFA